MNLATRLHPVGARTDDLRNQWIRGSQPGRGRSNPVVLLRTVVQDPLGQPHHANLIGNDAADAGVDRAWAEAQLTADVTMLGLGTGIRIALVPEAGRWFADILVIQTHGRLRVGRGNRTALAALQSTRRRLLATIADEGAHGHADAPRLRVIGPVLPTKVG
jgi:hypothetical protein